MGTSDGKAISLRVSDVDPASHKKKIAFKIFVEGENGGNPYTTASEELRQSLLPLMNKIRGTHGVYESGGDRVDPPTRLAKMSDPQMWPDTFAAYDCAMLQEASQQRSVFHLAAPGFHLFRTPDDFKHQISQEVDGQINQEVDVDPTRELHYFEPEDEEKDTTLTLGPKVFPLPADARRRSRLCAHRHRFGLLL